MQSNRARNDEPVEAERFLGERKCADETVNHVKPASILTNKLRRA